MVRCPHSDTQHPGIPSPLALLLAFSMATSGVCGALLAEPLSYPLPEFLPTPANLTFLPGQTAVLQCAIQNLGTRSVVWRKAADPNPLTIGTKRYVPSSRFSVQHEKHSLEWNLVIRDLEKGDSGVYECQVSSTSRSFRRNVLLRVVDTAGKTTAKPDIQISGPVFVEKGDRLSLVCNATGDDYPPDDLDWFKDGNKVTPDERTTVNKDVSLSEKTIYSTLTITRAEMEDAGTYVCRTSDLQITSSKLNVLNTDTSNEKRESSDTTDAERSVHSGGDRRHVQPVLPLWTLLLALHAVHAALRHAPVR